MASNAAMQQSSSTSSLQGFNKRKTPGFNMGSMDALDALNMGSTEQLALPSVENDFDIQNLKGSQDQLSSSPLTSGSSNGNNTKELKFEQKKVTSSQKTKVSYFKTVLVPCFIFFPLCLGLCYLLGCALSPCVWNDLPS